MPRVPRSLGTLLLGAGLFLSVGCRGPERAEPNPQPNVAGDAAATSTPEDEIVEGFNDDLTPNERARNDRFEDLRRKRFDAEAVPAAYTANESDGE